MLEKTASLPLRRRAIAGMMAGELRRDGRVDPQAASSSWPNRSAADDTGGSVGTRRDKSPGDEQCPRCRCSCSASSSGAAASRVSMPAGDAAGLASSAARARASAAAPSITAILYNGVRNQAETTLLAGLQHSGEHRARLRNGPVPPFTAVLSARMLRAARCTYSIGAIRRRCNKVYGIANCPRYKRHFGKIEENLPCVPC